MKKLLLILILCLSGAAFAASVEDDVTFYTQALAEGKSVDAVILESFAWKGISDPRVFDLIERRIAEKAEAGRDDRQVKKEVGLSLRALGFSGQAKYRAVLEEYRSDPTYERYARDALEDMPDYQRWNPIISDRATFDPRYSDDVNRIRNMLLSNDFNLKKVGAKRVYFQNKDDVLLDILAAQISASYMSNDGSGGDSIAWMVKALGSAHRPKDRPLIEEVAANAPDKTVVRHARKVLER